MKRYVDSETLTEKIKRKTAELGFSMVGIVPAAPSRRLDAYLRWVEQGYHGEMGYLARPDRLERRQDLNVILPGVASLVVVGLDYAGRLLPDAWANDPSRGRISNYAWGIDYHKLMEPRLKALGKWLTAEVGDAHRSKFYVDTGAILERDHAETAGLGFTGKNTMLIHPRKGSGFFLGELLTTAVLQFDEPKQMPTCGNCRHCLDACPTDAFPNPYLLDARRCISYLTIELKGTIPRPLRARMGNWIYGCDICQDVCPFNRFAPDQINSPFHVDDWEKAAPSLIELLTLDEEGFRERFAHSPIKRIKRERLLRNVVVAAGNWGNPTVLPYLEKLLTDRSPLLREHLIWALAQIPGGRNCIETYRKEEKELSVLAEIDWALAQKSV